MAARCRRIGLRHETFESFEPAYISTEMLPMSYSGPAEIPCRGVSYRCRRTGPVFMNSANVLL